MLKILTSELRMTKEIMGFSQGHLYIRPLWFTYTYCDLIDCYLETPYYNNNKQYIPTRILNKGKNIIQY